jgi:hypothetical protein
LHHAHAGEHGRVLAFVTRSGQSQLKVVDDADQPLEERVVRVFDRVLALARGAFFLVFEIGLGSQRKIAKAIKIPLQTSDSILRP